MNDNNKLWYNFLFTPGLDFVDERFFLRLNIKCRELAKTGLIERPRVLVDTRVADLSKGLPGTMMGGILTIAQETPALDYFWVIPNAAAWQAAIDKQYADAQVSGDLEEQQAFADVDPGQTPLPNLFLGLAIQSSTEATTDVQALVDIQGTRKFLIIDPLSGFMAGQLSGLDWVITSGATLDQAMVAHRTCNRSGIPHFHTGFTGDCDAEEWETRWLLGRNQFPLTMASK